MTAINDLTRIATFSGAVARNYHKGRRAQRPGTYVTPETIAEVIKGLAAEAAVVDHDMRAIVAAEIGAFAMRLALDARTHSEVEAIMRPAPEPRTSWPTDGDELSDPGAIKLSAKVAEAIARDPLGRAARAADAITRLAEAAQAGAALLAPRRISPAMVDNEIADEAYHVFPGTGLTICALTLANGHIVTGQSRPVDPAAFNAELGRDAAKGKAREQVFDLLAFRARDEIASAEAQGIAAE